MPKEIQMSNSVIVQVNAGRVTQLRLSGEEGATTTETAAAGETTTEAAVPKEPNPLQPDLKELYWAAGSFFALLLLMRYFLYPRVAKTMQARTHLISSQLAEADSIRAGAKGEVADYEADLIKVREEAAGVVDAARQTLEKERTAKFAEVNARIAERRAAATAEADAMKAGAAAQVSVAAQDVASHAAGIVLGAAPSADLVRTAVSNAMYDGGK
jgi:F-type H+-transporting ATPase subunit b